MKIVYFSPLKNHLSNEYDNKNLRFFHNLEKCIPIVVIKIHNIYLSKSRLTMFTNLFFERYFTLLNTSYQKEASEKNNIRNFILPLRPHKISYQYLLKLGP
jgi:hypothetical protein